MRISEYLEIGNKLKTARMHAGISQRNMATKLSLSYSTYSNYENGYSEPPMEIINQFCDFLEISVEQLFELKLAPTSNTTVKTFSDFISIIIDLDRRGLSIKGTTTYIQEENKLMAHLSLDIDNAQLATFVPDWNKVNNDLSSGLMDEDEYASWLENTLRIFNVPINDYISKK